MTDYETADQCAKQLAAAAEPTRIRIIELLLTGTKPVSEIATELKVEIVNISHHLGVLKNAGLLKDKKRGRFVDYTLNPAIFKENKGGMVADLGWCMLKLSKG